MRTSSLPSPVFCRISDTEQTEAGTVPVALRIAAPHQLTSAVLPVGVVDGEIQPEQLRPVHRNPELRDVAAAILPHPALHTAG